MKNSELFNFLSQEGKIEKCLEKICTNLVTCCSFVLNRVRLKLLMRSTAKIHKGYFNQNYSFISGNEMF